MTWLPIETAPKDGTPIMLWYKVWKCPIAVRWQAHNETFGPGWIEMTLHTIWPEDISYHWTEMPDAPLFRAISFTPGTSESDPIKETFSKL